MNPQTEQQATAAPTAVDPSLLRQIVEEMDAANPYGSGKYTDDDASVLGLPSLGSLRLARQMVKDWIDTPFMPAWIKNSKNPAGTFVATVVRGKELGFKMLEAVASLYLSPDGRLGLYGTAMLALMRRSGITLKFSDIEEDGKVVGVQVYGKRKDGDDYTARFTKMDAQRAGLIKGGGAHEKYPLLMCTWRASSILFRTLASDLTGGPLYSREELEEEVDLHDVIRETESRQAKAENPYKVPPKTQGDTNGHAAQGNGPLGGEPATVAAEISTPTETPAVETTGKAQGSPAPDSPATTSNSSAGEVGGGADAPPFTVTVEPPLFAPSGGGPQDGISIRPGLDKAQDGVVPSPAADSSKVVAMPSKAVLEELSALVKDEKVMKEFMRGFLQSAIKKNDPRMPDALAVLLAVAKSSYLPQLTQDAYGSGVKAAAGWKTLQVFIDACPAESKALAKSVGLKRYPDEGGGALIEYLADPIHVETMDMKELKLFLDILDGGCSAGTATKLREAQVESGLTLVEVLALRNERGKITGTMELSEEAILTRLLTFAKDPLAGPIEPSSGNLWDAMLAEADGA